MIQLRFIQEDEIEWVNARYDEVKFKHSHFDYEKIAIAEIDGQKAGIGRLVAIDQSNLELGGIYVFPAFQGKGVATKIVEFLLSNAPTSKTVYCIPFAKLVPFYQRFGFKLCIDCERVAKEIIDKYFWCKEEYEEDTALLILNEI